MTDITAAQQLATVDPSALSITRAIRPCGTLDNMPCTLLNDGNLYIIDHETANENPSAGAYWHSVFVNSGGGSADVSFHFTVDKTGAYQMIPLNLVGYHAADGLDNRATDIGGFRGVAIETCVNDPIGSEGWLQTKRNLVALIAAIMSGDARIDYGGRSHKDFAVVRILPHYAVSDNTSDKHDCPQRQLREGLMDRTTGKGIIQDAVALTLNRIAGVIPPKTYPSPVGMPFRIGEATGPIIASNGVTWFPVTFTATTLRRTTPRTYASSKAPQAAVSIPAGTDVLVAAWLVNEKGQKWYVLNNQQRVLASAFDIDMTMRTRSNAA